MDLSSFSEAQRRIRPYVERTPLIPFYPLPGVRLFLKCEHLQATNSFKVRGAFNAMLSLSPEERAKGVVTRSMGNFAQAVAYAGHVLKIPATIILPANVPIVKKEGVEKYKARAILQEGGSRREQQVVEDIAAKEGLAMLSPFNIPPVIEAAGAMAVEIHEQLPTIRVFFGQVGGGGMMAGMSCAFKKIDPSIRTIAVEPAGANDYFLSRKKGSPVFLEKVDTIADGLRAPQVGDVPWPLLQKYVDEAVTVTDREMIDVLRVFYEKMGIILEASGVTGLAYAIEWCKKRPKEDAVCVLTGANVDRSSFFSWIGSESKKY
jgi:threonine dehydratase